MAEGARWPLAQMRVVDLSAQIAGPYCTKMLADAGADVIKVEAPSGDPLRRWTASGVTVPAGQDGALFQYLNASKRSVVADPATESGRECLRDLAATADVAVEDAPAGMLAQAGISFHDLRARRPGLSLVSISPWGTEGPWARRPATEFTLQAATGSTAHRGPSNRVPVAAGGRIGEWIAGAFAAVGAVLAWLSSRRSGRGHHVDLSMFEAMLLAMTYYHDLSGQWRGGLLPRAVEVPSIEPAKDGWIGFCTITSQQWKDFCVLIEQPELAEDERYLDGSQRSAALDFMQRIIRAWTRRHTVEEIIELASALRIPVAPIGDGRNLPQQDHFVARGVFVNHPAGFIQPRVPYRLEKTSLRPFGPAPCLGEHTDEVLQEVAAGREGTRLSPVCSVSSVREPAATTAPCVSAEAGRDAALPFSGLRVIDLSTFWAGPVVGSVLADMGADVIKVESIQRPDGMRFAGAVLREAFWEWSPVFAGANTGKRGITLRLDSEEGLALLKRLIGTADVVIENFSPRVMENFGLGWEVVRELNPRTIMVRMPAFGLDGPWRDRAGFAMTVEQASGLAWITGYEDMPLVVRGACDPLGSMHALFALVLALEHRQRTGEGQLVEVPLVEVALNVAAEQVIEYSAYGRFLQRSGNRGPVAAPQGVYPCAEQGEYVAVAVATDDQWRALRTLLGSPPWSLRPELETAAGRRGAHDEIDRELSAWLAGLGRDEAVERLIAAGIPAHAVVNGHRVMPNPQLEHRRFFQVLRHPVTGETRYPGLPMSFSGLDRHLHRRPPPTLGQHNDEILGGELGLSARELEELRARKIIGERPWFL